MKYNIKVVLKNIVFFALLPIWVIIAIIIDTGKAWEKAVHFR